MTAVNDFLRQTAKDFGRPQVGMWEAEFAKSIIEVTELAFLIIPDFNPSQVFGPARWTPYYIPEPMTIGLVTFDLPVIQLPSRGDRALVTFSSDQNLWVVSWGKG